MELEKTPALGPYEPGRARRRGDELHLHHVRKLVLKGAVCLPATSNLCGCFLGFVGAWEGQGWELLRSAEGELVGRGLSLPAHVLE